jgi:hypothetical protein
MMAYRQRNSSPVGADVASVAVGHAALHAPIAAYPGERFTLRNGILVIREHELLSSTAIRMLIGL